MFTVLVSPGKVFLCGQTEILGPATNFARGVASSRGTGGARPCRSSSSGCGGGSGRNSHGGGGDDNVVGRDESNHAESLILTLHSLIKILPTMPLRLVAHHRGSSVFLRGGACGCPAVGVVASVSYPKWHCGGCFVGGFYVGLGVGGSRAVGFV